MTVENRCYHLVVGQRTPIDCATQFDLVCHDVYRVIILLRDFPRSVCYKDVRVEIMFIWMSSYAAAFLLHNAPNRHVANSRSSVIPSPVTLATSWSDIAVLMRRRRRSSR